MAHSKGVVFIHYWRLDSCDFCSVFFEEAARLLKAVQDPVQLCASHHLASSTQHNTIQHNTAQHSTAQHVVVFKRERERVCIHVCVTCVVFSSPACVCVGVCVFVFVFLCV